MLRGKTYDVMEIEIEQDSFFSRPTFGLSVCLIVTNLVVLDSLSQSMSFPYIIILSVSHSENHQIVNR